MLPVLGFRDRRIEIRPVPVFLVENREEQHQSGVPVVLSFSLYKSLETNSLHRKTLSINNLQSLSMSG